MCNVTARIPKGFISLALIWQIGAFAIYASPIFGEHAKAVTAHDARGYAPASEGEDAAPAHWNSIESGYFTIYYRSSVNLRRIEANLRRRIFYFDPASSQPDAGMEDKVAYRVDTLSNRVKEILDMHPNMPKISIRIFKDRSELREEYFKIFKTKEDLASFYVYKYDTIYTSEEEISDSVIAHEMAHAVIDHYFDIIPPKTVAEVLASYVDIHLEE